MVGRYGVNVVHALVFITGLSDLRDQRLEAFEVPFLLSFMSDLSSGYDRCLPGSKMIDRQLLRRHAIKNGCRYFVWAPVQWFLIIKFAV